MKKLLNNCRGSVSIVVLLLSIILVGIVEALYHSVCNEVTAANEVIKRRQLQAAAADVLDCSLELEQRGELQTDLVIAETTLYPEGETLTIETLLQKDEVLPGRLLKVVAATTGNTIALTEICLQAPLGEKKSFYNNTMTAGGEITGTVRAADASAIVDEAGNILAGLDISAYKKWRRYDFLTKEEYQQTGFGRGVYYNDDIYGVTIPSLMPEVNGDAFLLAEKNVTIESDLHLPGRITLVVGGNLKLGDNVHLEQALVVVKNNLQIGRGCIIKGIVVAGGNIIIEEEVDLQRNENVLKPYFTAKYLE